MFLQTMFLLLFVLLILVTVTIVVLLRSYLPKKVKMYEAYREVSKKQLWSPLWATLVFIPFLGSTWLLKIKEIGDESLQLFVQPKLNFSQNQSDFLEFADFYLFESHHDRSTGEERATRVFALDKNKTYRFISGDSDHFLSGPNTVFITVMIPRLIRRNIQFATMFFSNHGWQLSNMASSEVIPILRLNTPNSDDHILFNYIKFNVEHILESGDKFLISASEFQLICLPLKHDDIDLNVYYASVAEKVHLN